MVFPKKMVKTIRKSKNPNAEFYGNMMAYYLELCLNKEMYNEEKRVQILSDFLDETTAGPDDYSYSGWMHWVEKRAWKVLVKHGIPEEVYPVVKQMIDRFFIEERVFCFEQEFAELNADGSFNDKIIPLDEAQDIHSIDMAYLFAGIPYKKEDEEFLKTVEVDYDYDHHHMAVWFSAQVTLGNGNYSRKVPNISSKTTYNRLNNPYSLLWIATVLGEDKAIVKQAAENMGQSDKKNFAAMSGIVRKYIPYKRVFQLAKAVMNELGKLEK